MKKGLLLIAITIIFFSCGPTIQVFSDHDKDISMQNYKSYGWLDIKEIESKNSDPRHYNELTDKRIRVAVNRELGTRGFAMTENGPQLKLHYHIIVENKSMLTTELPGMLYGPYWEKNKTTVYQYREGTLIIDIMDVASNQLVWRGWATDVISEKSLKDPEQAINNAVREIFKKFP